MSRLEATARQERSHNCITSVTDWRRLHQAVRNENDADELLGLVHELETALVKRSEELAPDLGSEELREIQVAVADLLSIKITKLAWPDPRRARG